MKNPLKMMKAKKVSKVDLKKTLHQMIKWAFECGEILNEHLILSYTKPLEVIDKGKEGVATEADMLSEKFVMEKIKKHYPDHKILSEEDAFSKKLSIKGVKSNEYLWLIDPLDGTNNFFNKVPFFGVSLALNRGNKTLLGVVYNPVTTELFYARRGYGAYFTRFIGNKKIKFRLKRKINNKKIQEALLSANLTNKRIEKSLFKKIPEIRATRRFGSAALEMSYVAAGMLDAYWEHRLQPWDMAAAALICEEAGAVVSTIKGDKFHPFSSSVLCAESTLHNHLLSFLND